MLISLQRLLPDPSKFPFRNKIDKSTKRQTRGFPCLSPTVLLFRNNYYSS
jgi:hypothetical protein